MFKRALGQFAFRVAGSALVMLLAAVAPATAQAPSSSGGCTQPLAEPITVIDAEGGGNPLMSKDGCWLFVMVNRPKADGTGVLVFRRAGGTFSKVRTIPTPFSTPASSMVITRDQKLLIVAATNSLTFIDVERATSGDGDAVAGRAAGLAGAFRMAVTPDDRMLFVPQFGPARVSVIDLDRARRDGFSAASLAATTIPTGQSPITALVSPDGRYLYQTNLVAPDVLAGPLTCIDGKQREGGIQVVDVQKARTDAATATLGWAFPAGCGPNAMALSPDGTRLSNTAANNIFDPNAGGNMLLVFDTRPTRDGKLPTRIGAVPLPKGPIAVADTGRRIVIGFAPDAQNASQADLLVIDPAKIASAAGAVIGTIAFPAGNLALATDGRTLIAAGSLKGVALIDLDRVAIQPLAR